MKHLKTFEAYYDDFVQRDLHETDILDEEERLRMIDYIMDYVEANANPNIDIDEARFDLMNRTDQEVIYVYNQINAGGQTYESLADIMKFKKSK